MHAVGIEIMDPIKDVQSLLIMINDYLSPIACMYRTKRGTHVGKIVPEKLQTKIDNGLLVLASYSFKVIYIASDQVCKLLCALKYGWNE